MRKLSIVLGLATLTACFEVDSSTCEETQDDPTVVDTGDTGDIDDEVIEDEPLVNPYAYVGEQHNLYLDCTRTLEARDARDVLKGLWSTCHFDGDDSFFDIYVDSYKLVGTSLYATGVNADLDPEELEILARADVIVRSYEPGEALLRLEWLEQVALQDEDASVPLLAALATARASGAYWQDEVDQDGNGGTRAKWWQILLADAGGALVGGLVGGPAGGIALGTTASTLVAKD